VQHRLIAFLSAHRQALSEFKSALRSSNDAESVLAGSVATTTRDHIIERRLDSEIAAFDELISQLGTEVRPPTALGRL